MRKVKETGIHIDKLKCEKPKTVRTPENTAAVAQIMCEASSVSIHRCSQQLNISETSLRRILHKDLGMTPYKLSFGSGVEANCVFASLSKSTIDLQKMPILVKK